VGSFVQNHRSGLLETEMLLEVISNKLGIALVAGPQGSKHGLVRQVLSDRGYEVLAKRGRLLAYREELRSLPHGMDLILRTNGISV
jgi:hypothetical protein